MESWRRVWRDGVAPLLTLENMQNLLKGLQDDDPALMQGQTTRPAPLSWALDWPVEAACPISYCGWKDGLETVGEVEEFFAKLCYAADQALGEPAGIRWFLNWIDETPRDTMRWELSQEIRLSIKERLKEMAS